jgi:hypothetical protein
MPFDPIVDETRKARESVVQPFGENIHAFFEYIRERERQSGVSVVTLEPNAPETTAPSIAAR